MKVFLGDLTSCTAFPDSDAALSRLHEKAHSEERQHDQAGLTALKERAVVGREITTAQAARQAHAADSPDADIDDEADKGDRPLPTLPTIPEPLSAKATG